MIPTRFLSQDDISAHVPVHVVWELTLACDLACNHCGSRAGSRRPDELNTAEALDVVAALARLGAREVTLIGGEAYLRRDWIEIIRAITEAGMTCTLQSGARNLTEKRVAAAAEAGLKAAGVSIDGLEDLHDELRGVSGSFAAATAALGRLRRHGIVPSVNTQISAPVVPQLRDLFRHIVSIGAQNWQVQLTVAMGRAADNHELLLQPYQLGEVMPLLAELFEEGLRHGLLLQPGNNIGFFGPHESKLRGNGDPGVHFIGCSAGRTGMGIESNGVIKGCPSLPTASYTGGNVRDLTLEDIWENAPELAFARSPRRDELWGFCGTCYYADVCAGGCTWTSHSLLGRRGNNPYCHHRVLELEAQGLRERIVPAEQAPGLAFDHGRFDLVLETLDGEYVQTVSTAGVLTIGRPRRPDPAPLPDEPPWLFLDVCRACHRHVFPGTDECPFCDADVAAEAAAYDEALAEAHAARDRLVALLGG